jgi:hypothetical protein
MDARSMREYLETLCEELDKGKPIRQLGWVRKLALPAAFGLGFGLSVGIGGCDTRTTAGNDTEICDDGIDNDGDGKTDCDDRDCDSFAACQPMPEYGVPFETSCADGIDNDHDGLTDCADRDCDDVCPQPAYMGPFGEWSCDDGRDNDGNGLTDCDDPDCASFAACLPVNLYGVPSVEYSCNDGKDNDLDGKTDCDDEDCYNSPDCMPQPLYMAVFEPPQK